MLLRISHECYTACASSKVMGKRKFKLGRTKERAKHSFIVSIERKNVSVHVSSIAITRYQLEARVDPSPSTCTVSVPVISEGVVQTGQWLVSLF